MRTSATRQTKSAAAKTTWKWDETKTATTAWAVVLGTLALGAVPGASDWFDGRSYIPYFLTIAGGTIFIGAHRSLSSPFLQTGLTLKESAFAPVAASFSLFGIYLVIKNLNVDVLATFISLYFGVLTVAAIGGVVRTPVSQVLGDEKDVVIWTPPADWFEEEESTSSSLDSDDLNVRVSDGIALSLGVGLAIADALTQHQVPALSNFSAICVAAELLAGVSLGSVQTASALLLGLLAYDVFWVFGSAKAVGENVMVVVATSKVVAGPTRLLFPRPSLSESAAAAVAAKGMTIPAYTLLGLGDVLVPGLFIALALRADLARNAAWGDFADGLDPIRDPTSGFVKERPLFCAALGGYAAGLGMAFVANAYFKAAQPALLYLSPCVILAVLGCATAKGELGSLLRWRDESRRMRTRE
ncbi:minor histocompatibility antigen H13 [Pseudoscourfieldia marina]